MTDVFLSYSRRDAAFVERLALGLREGGRDVWVDTEGIADAEHFPDALRSAIESADAFVFVITPDAASSRYCLQEVEHAQAMGKRIVPLLRRPVPDDQLHPEVRDRNWVPFEDDAAFDANLGRLDKALSRDLEHAKTHTRWLTRALEWEAARDASLLPRGSELTRAERWLAAAGPGAEPQPTALQREFLLAARQAATRRQRRLIGVATAVAAVSLVLLAVAILAERSASNGRTLARAQGLAARSEAAIATSPLAAVRLAARSLRTRSTPAGQRAAKEAVDANSLLAAAGPFAHRAVTDACGSDQVAYRPDGREIAATTCDGSVRILDGDTARVLRRWRPAPDPVSVAYRPGGRELAVLARRAIVILDAGTGARRATIRLPGAHLLAGGVQSGAAAVRWSRDGTRLVAVWGTRAFLAQRTGAVRVLLGNQAEWGGVTFASNDRAVAVGTVDDTVEIYDGRTGVHRRTLPVSDGPRYAFGPTVAATSDGTRLIIGRYTPGDEGRVEVWSTRSWKRESILSTVRFAAPLTLDLSPDDSRVAFTSIDGRVEISSVRSGRTLLDVPVDYFAGGLAFSPDSRRLASVSGRSNSTVQINRAQGADGGYFEGAPVRLDGVEASATLVRAVAVSPSGGVRVETWDRRTGKRQRRGHHPAWHPGHRAQPRRALPRRDPARRPRPAPHLGSRQADHRQAAAAHDDGADVRERA